MPTTRTATVTLFKDCGKYYTTESWRVPEDAIGPYDMERSPDFRRISDGPVLVDSDASLAGDENWGYPHLFPVPTGLSVAPAKTCPECGRQVDSSGMSVEEGAPCSMAGMGWSHADDCDTCEFVDCDSSC